jgi:hypothetical protein
MVNRPPQLDYASAQPAWHQRKWVRQAIKLFVRAAIVCGVLLVAGLLWIYARQAYWARVCMNYMAPPDEIESEICLVLDNGRISGSVQHNHEAPACWRGFTGSHTLPALFLHGRSSTNRGSRLLFVFYADMGDAANWYFCATTHHHLGLTGHNVTVPIHQNHPMTRRFFAGQPDAVDPTHFTIGYEEDGKNGTIDG